MNRLLFACLSTVAVALMAPGSVAVGEALAQVVAPGPLSEAIVETGSGAHRFQVEIADEPAERAQGLMYRRDIPPDQGMLFDMGETRPVGFWMRNTYVSLDIIFIGEDGVVRSIAERTEPLSEALIESGEPVRFVLELVAGTSSEIGLAPGDRVSHPVIEAVAAQ